jgi:hypothetical protein
MCHCRHDRGVVVGVGVGEDRPKGYSGADNRRADGPDGEPADGRPHPSHDGHRYARTRGRARRLKAMKRLGETMIEVRRVGDLTEQERAIIELEENLQRKNLTPLERSETTVRLVQAVGTQLLVSEKTQEGQAVQPNSENVVHTQTPVSPEPDGKQSYADRVPKKGRTYQEKVDSQKNVAAELGVSQSTFSDIQQHLAAVERYPEPVANDVPLSTGPCTSWSRSPRCWCGPGRCRPMRRSPRRRCSTRSPKPRIAW